MSRSFLTHMLPVALSVILTACTIEPPLKLAGRDVVDVQFPEVLTDISVIWEVEADWRHDWCYGWDETDIANWGTLEYPDPSSYEVRSYFIGQHPGDEWQNIDRLTVHGKSFRHTFDFGYHDLLFWSNIDSPDGTQVLIVDETDANAIVATTSRSRLSYSAPSLSRGEEFYNNPEIFYAAKEEDFHVSDNTDDYDYFDEERNVWVKNLKTVLNPMVYTYLVQCIIYNNNNRVVGLADRASVTSMADGVNIHTGVTSSQPVNVAYPMRLKKGLTDSEGVPADILGGKLTTFGLCDMQPWNKTRGVIYNGPRSDLKNMISLDLEFNNTTQKVFTYDVTDQIQKHAHGGVITIRINADTLSVPSTPSTGGAGTFQPTVAVPDSITHEFEI